MKGYSMFKTAILGGYDKEDVEKQFQSLKDQAANEKASLEKLVFERDERIRRLLDQNSVHKEEMENLQEALKAAEEKAEDSEAVKQAEEELARLKEELEALKAENERLNAESENSAAKISQLMSEISSKDGKIDELQSQLHDSMFDKNAFEKEITQKYQKYVDNYESISKLLVEAQIQADKRIEEADFEADKRVEDAKKKCDVIISEAEQMVADKHAEAERIRKETEDEIEHRLEAAQAGIDLKVADGLKEFNSIQEAASNMIKIMQMMQTRFGELYDEAQVKIARMPEILTSLEDTGARAKALNMAALEVLDESHEESFESSAESKVSSDSEDILARAAKLIDDSDKEEQDKFYSGATDYSDEIEEDILESVAAETDQDDDTILVIEDN